MDVDRITTAILIELFNSFLITRLNSSLFQLVGSDVPPSRTCMVSYRLTRRQTLFFFPDNHSSAHLSSTLRQERLVSWRWFVSWSSLLSVSCVASLQVRFKVLLRSRRQRVSSQSSHPEPALRWRRSCPVSESVDTWQYEIAAHLQLQQWLPTSRQRRWRPSHCSNARNYASGEMRRCTLWECCVNVRRQD